MGKLKTFLKNWLEIKEPVEPTLNKDLKKQDKDLKKQDKDLKKQVEQLKTDLEFWHKQFREYSFTICLYCKKKMMVWPYEKTAYYRTEKGYVHHACYDRFLKDQRQKNG